MQLGALPFKAILLAGCALLLMTAACSAGSPPPAAAGRPGDAVVVASFNFPESELLAEIYAQALSSAGIPDRLELDLGTREMVLPAFEQGLVDVVPEYIGSLLQALAPGAAGDLSGTAAVTAGVAGQLAPWHGQVLQPSPAEDQNGVAVTALTAARLGLRTTSDLAGVASRLRITGPPECPSRQYCLLGLERVYGIHFGQFVPLDTEQQRVTALEEGVADVAVLFTTSADLAGGDPVLLADDRGLQPAENVTPIVSDRAVERFGGNLVSTLDAVSARLSTGELRFLNWRVVVAGRSVAGEAHGWLVRQGLVARSG